MLAKLLDQVGRALLREGGDHLTPIHARDAPASCLVLDCERVCDCRSRGGVEHSFDFGERERPSNVG